MGDHQDWGTITWEKRAPTGAAAKDKRNVATAARSGNVETQEKFSQGNKSAQGKTPENAWKLDSETENFKHAKVSMEFKMALQQARLAKKMTQKQLADVCNEKQSVINEYEAGKAIPNGQVIQKMNKALGVRLPKAK